MNKLTVLFLTLLFSTGCFANNIEQCGQEIKISKDFAFKGLKSRSDELSKALCEVHLYDTSDEPDYSSATVEAIKWRNAALAEVAPLKQAGIDLEPFVTALFNHVKDNKAPGAFQLVKVSRAYYLSIDDGINGAISDDQANEKCKKETLGFGKTCYEVLEDFRVAVDAANADVNRINLAKVSDKIGLYSKQWDKYFTDARSQTPLELGLNTWLYKDELTANQFVLPPSYQVALLHPSIVFEYVSDAADGDQEKEALAMEWIGINWWNLKVPLGLSLVTTYSDRASVDDVGYGVMLHIDNDYSIGVTDHDGDTGVFVTIDLLKLIQGKEKRFKKYKKKAENINDLISTGF